MNRQYLKDMIKIGKPVVSFPIFCYDITKSHNRIRSDRIYRAGKEIIDGNIYKFCRGV